MQNQIVILAASLGGPPLVNDILSGLSRDFSLPVVVMQHMESDFSEPLASAWSKTSNLNLVRLVDEEIVRDGWAYVLPFNAYPVFDSHGSKLTMSLSFIEDANSVCDQWNRVVRECVDRFNGNTVLVMLTNSGLDCSDLKASLELLMDSGGKLVYCRESSALTAFENFDEKYSESNVEMEIDQIVGYLQGLSQQKIKVSKTVRT